MGLSRECRGEVELAALAGELAPLLRAGDLLALDGELGSGKTTFVRHLVRALGSPDPVTSPTFTILQSYDGPLPVNHWDLYRLGSRDELLDTGFLEVLEEAAVCLVEWPELARPLVPERLEIRFSHAGPEARVVELVPVGEAWSARLTGFGA